MLREQKILPDMRCNECRLQCNAGGLQCNGGGLQCNGGGLQCIGGGLQCNGGGLQCNGGGLQCNGGGLQCIGGRLQCNGGGLQCNGGGLQCNGGGLQCNGGGLQCNGGGLQCNGGGLQCNGGGLQCNGGGLQCNGGGLQCNGGGLQCNGGGLHGGVFRPGARKPSFFMVAAILLVLLVPGITSQTMMEEFCLSSTDHRLECAKDKVIMIEEVIVGCSATFNCPPNPNCTSSTPQLGEKCQCKRRCKIKIKNKDIPIDLWKPWCCNSTANYITVRYQCVPESTCDRETDEDGSTRRPGGPGTDPDHTGTPGTEAQSQQSLVVGLSVALATVTVAAAVIVAVICVVRRRRWQQQDVGDDGGGGETAQGEGDYCEALDVTENPQYGGTDVANDKGYSHGNPGYLGDLDHVGGEYHTIEVVSEEKDKRPPPGGAPYPYSYVDVEPRHHGNKITEAAPGNIYTRLVDEGISSDADANTDVALMKTAGEAPTPPRPRPSAPPAPPRSAPPPHGKMSSSVAPEAEGGSGPADPDFHSPVTLGNPSPSPSSNPESSADHSDPTTGAEHAQDHMYFVLDPAVTEYYPEDPSYSLAGVSDGGDGGANSTTMATAAKVSPSDAPQHPSLHLAPSLD